MNRGERGGMWDRILVIVMIGGIGTNSFPQLLLWPQIFFVSESTFVLFEPYVRFHIFSSVLVTEWPPIGE